MHEGDPGSKGGPQQGADARARRPGLGVHPFFLYVSEDPDGARRLTGGGTTLDGICAHILSSVAPGGTWNGLRYEDFLPGHYDIVDGRVFHEDGSAVPSCET